MKKCPFCAEKIQSEAIKCRYCGSTIPAPPPMKISFTDPWFRYRLAQGICYTMVAILVVTLFSSRHTTVEQERAPAAVTAIRVDSAELVRAYTANEVAADKTYKNHVVRVTGFVTQISKDITDQPYIVLGWDGSEDPIRKVQCAFNDGHESELATLHVGERKTVVGKCEGLMMNVQLGDCWIEK